MPEHNHPADQQAKLAASDPTSAIKDYWQRLRLNGNSGASEYFKARTPDALLRHCFVLQRVGTQVARFRASGSNMSRIMRIEPRGMLIDSIFLPAAQRRLGAIIADVCAGPATATLPLRALSGGNQIGSATMMLMPLPDGYGETTRIFGAALTPPVPTARPVRFDFDPAQKVTFEPLECARPNGVSRPALRLVVDNS